jgi:RNA polymerase sigma factor (TIGR02999 family)
VAGRRAQAQAAVSGIGKNAPEGALRAVAAGLKDYPFTNVARWWKSVAVHNSVASTCQRIGLVRPAGSDGLVFRSRGDRGGSILGGMADVTRLLDDAAVGNPKAAAELLPLVYDELRKLAAARLAEEKPGQTLQATALVHEAYLRLVGGERPQDWDGRGHFFAAAAEAMRRILVEQARRKGSLKRGGGTGLEQVDPDELPVTPPGDPVEILAIHEALDQLSAESPRKARVVKLRYFLGCTMAETAEILGIAAKTAEEDWTYARAWLRRRWLLERGRETPG